MTHHIQNEHGVMSPAKAELIPPAAQPPHHVDERMNNANITTSPPRACQGFSLFEVLVTVVVVGIGLLGLAGLQFAGLRASNNAQDATYATQLAQEVAERIRANRAGALGSTSNYNDVAITKTSAFTETTCGTPTDATGCSTPAAMRNYDIYKLYQRITTNNGNPPILTDGAIRIKSGDNINFTIYVFWGNSDTTLPTTCPATGWRCVTLSMSLV